MNEFAKACDSFLANAQKWYNVASPLWGPNYDPDKDTEYAAQTRRFGRMRKAALGILAAIYAADTVNPKKNLQPLELLDELDGDEHFSDLLDFLWDKVDPIPHFHGAVSVIGRLAERNRIMPVNIEVSPPSATANPTAPVAPKGREKAARAAFITRISLHPTLLDDRPSLAKEFGKTVRTINRWVADFEREYQSQHGRTPPESRLVELGNGKSSKQNRLNKIRKRQKDIE